MGNMRELPKIRGPNLELKVVGRKELEGTLLDPLIPAAPPMGVAAPPMGVAEPPEVEAGKKAPVPYKDIEDKERKIAF